VTAANLDGEAMVCEVDGIADFDRPRSALPQTSKDRLPVRFDLLELQRLPSAPHPRDERRTAVT